jgi:dienelactone hydrolase
LPGFKFYGIIMVPKKVSADGKFPLVICQHGGGGTPELCSDIHGKNNYSHMTRRMLEYGVCVFAPQLYLWNSQTYIIPQKRGEVDRELKRYGSSLVGLEIYCIRKAIDYMTAKDYIDGDKIAMHGLSYGGIYTVYTMAAEPRIKAGYSCGSFNDRSEPTVLPDVCFFNSGNTFMDAEVAGLCAPRPLYIEVGKADPVFNWQTAETEFDRVVKYYEAYGTRENLKFKIWEGGHTVCDTDNGHRFVMDALGHKI